MLSIINSMSLNGLEGYLVEVQVDVSNGLPYWEIVGLPDVSVKESKERVKTAIRNSNFEFLSKRIIINLAPVDTKKEGPLFDLPIAIAILINLGYIQKKDYSKNVFLGALSLDGSIKSINGVLPMCIDAKKLGIKKIIVPYENIKEASIVSGIEIIGAKNLEEVVQYLNSQKEIKSQTIKTEKLLENTNIYDVDFAEVKGQENVKRALEIAAAGSHNCIMVGIPRVR